jgi:hypothetical protein
VVPWRSVEWANLPSQSAVSGRPDTNFLNEGQTTCLGPPGTSQGISEGIFGKLSGPGAAPGTCTAVATESGDDLLLARESRLPANSLSQGISEGIFEKFSGHALRLVHTQRSPRNLAMTCCSPGSRGSRQIPSVREFLREFCGIMAQTPQARNINKSNG